MNAAGYDAMALGNNEFRDLVPNLLQREKEAHFPMLSANVRLKATGKPVGKEFVVLKRAGLRIGIFGLTTPRITTYAGLSDIAVEDPFDAAHRMVQLLRPRVDLLIALTHIGFHMDRVLAEEEPGLDVIVGGDTHTRLDQPYKVSPAKAPAKVIPIVQDGEYGVRQGRLDLWVQPGRKPGPVGRFTGSLIVVSSKYPEDPRVNRVLKPYLPKAGSAPRARMIPTPF
jgi:2',3'-cyclic-nucleotide 2'-phosphodiesterase (5'-nucleotidase family)